MRQYIYKIIFFIQENYKIELKLELMHAKLYRFEYIRGKATLTPSMFKTVN